MNCGTKTHTQIHPIYMSKCELLSELFIVYYCTLLSTARLRLQVLPSAMVVRLAMPAI